MLWHSFRPSCIPMPPRRRINPGRIGWQARSATWRTPRSNVALLLGAPVAAPRWVRRMRSGGLVTRGLPARVAASGVSPGGSMSGGPVRWPIVLLGAIACGEAGESTSVATRIPAPSVSNGLYALRSVAGELLPQPTLPNRDAPQYVAGTIRFDIAVAADVPAPPSLTRTCHRTRGSGRAPPT